MSDGKEALEAFNDTQGLALNADEIAYLMETFDGLNRNPTDVEIYMFAQINSEHCRHKIFNAQWFIDGVEQEHSLFKMIKNTFATSKDQRVLSAYSDNAAVMQGHRINRFYPEPKTKAYQRYKSDTDILMKVETHNHPSAISPYFGAATGSGGEIRDEGATGLGAKPKAGLCGFSVSDLHIPQFTHEWELDASKPEHIASALDIMIQGPIGSASFNNEFGRPCTTGYFRTFDQRHISLRDNERFAYHKPIMIAGGLGQIERKHIIKKPFASGTKLICLGSPAMLIGLGGGSVSSSSQSDSQLDFASVQRANPESQRRCQEVIDACWQLGDQNPIAFIHDVGAGGLSNALTELVKDGERGGAIDLRKILVDEASMSPLEIWCNESQERYVLAIAPENLSLFEAICQRERCDYAIVGEAVQEPHLSLTDDKAPDRLDQPSPVDMSPVDIPPVNIKMEALFAKVPPLQKRVQTQTIACETLDLSKIEIKEAIERILNLPTVASKSFLITIADRSVGGLVAQDQMVGAYQVPVADCSVTVRALMIIVARRWRWVSEHLWLF